MGLVDGYGCAEKQIHRYSVYLSGILRTEKAPISHIRKVWMFVLSWCGVYVLVHVISSSS